MLAYLLSATQAGGTSKIKQLSDDVLQTARYDKRYSGTITAATHELLFSRSYYIQSI